MLKNLAEKESAVSDGETNFYFEYRPLTDTEKQTFTGNNKQDVLNERTYGLLQEKYGNEHGLFRIWETDKDDKSFLLNKLNHYTRQNKYDFFIHKT